MKAWLLLIPLIFSILGCSNKPLKPDFRESIESVGKHSIEKDLEKLRPYIPTQFSFQGTEVDWERFLKSYVHRLKIDGDSQCMKNEIACITFSTPYSVYLKRDVFDRDYYERISILLHEAYHFAFPSMRHRKCQKSALAACDSKNQGAYALEMVFLEHFRKAYCAKNNDKICENLVKVVDRLAFHLE